MAIATRSAESAPAPNRHEVPAERKSRPVVLWAGLGAVFAAFALYVWTAWILGPHFESVDAGPSTPPTWMRVTMDIWTVVGFGLLALVLYQFVVRPWRRERALSSDGLFCLGFGAIYFWDPFINYSGAWFTYNSYLTNYGSWVYEIPGWNSPVGEPGAMFAEPVLFIWPAYMYCLFTGVIFGCFLMRKFKARYPRTGTLGMIGFAWGLFFLFDVFIEAIVWMPLGFFSFPGAHGEVSINAGTYYQYPIYEGLMWGGLWASWACLRYFKNDQGETVMERGVSQLRIGRKSKTAVRFLAIFAGLSLAYNVVYNLPAQWVGTHADSWPADVQERSYLTNNICGGNTDRACPGADIPNPRGMNSIRLDPDGKLVVPPGAQLPTRIPLAD